MQAKCENLAIQLESTKVKLDLESKINSIETQNKGLQEQVNELKVSQRTQMEIEQTVHQQEQEREQQKPKSHSRKSQQVGRKFKTIARVIIHLTRKSNLKKCIEKH